MKLLLTAAAMMALGGIAFAQHQQSHQHGASPYAGMQQRPVKALSEQQVADLKAGRGMGLALAAEMNGYPGPMHVLELADQLGLNAELQQQMRQLVESMKAEAVPMGEQLLARETALDRAFAERTISPNSLAQLTVQIGETQAQLRAIHLKYHLTTADLLSPHQRHRYAELRGYR